MDHAHLRHPFTFLLTSAFLGLACLAACGDSSTGDDDGSDSDIDLDSGFEASPSSFELEGTELGAGRLAHDDYAKRIDIVVEEGSDDFEIGERADYFATGVEDEEDMDASETDSCGLVFEVTNVSDEPRCFIELSQLGLLSESDRLKSTLDRVTIVGSPGRTPDWAHTLPCLAPGETGWAIATVTTERCFEVEGLRVGTISSTAKPELLVAPRVVATEYELTEDDDLVVRVENQSEDADYASGYVVFLSDEGRAVGIVRLEDSTYLAGGEGDFLTESVESYPFGTVHRIRVHLTTDS